MEPKVIKEENLEKDAANYVDATSAANRTRSSKGKRKNAANY